MKSLIEIERNFKEIIDNILLSSSLFYEKERIEIYLDKDYYLNKYSILDIYLKNEIELINYENSKYDKMIYHREDLNLIYDELKNIHENIKKENLSIIEKNQKSIQKIEKKKINNFFFIKDYNFNYKFFINE